MMILMIISLILFLFMVLALVNRSTSTSSSKHEIPGPPKLPLIGNLHLLLLSKSPPHHVFRDLAAKYGPLMRLQLGEVPFLFVSSAEVAEEVMKTHDVVFANRPPLAAGTVLSYGDTDIGMAPYGEYWRSLRKICTLEMLSSRRVRSFRPIRQEENENVVRSIAAKEGSPVNLSETIFMSLFDITSKAAVGKEADDKNTLTSAMKGIMKLVGGFCLADLYPSLGLLALITGFDIKLRRIFRQTDRILERTINQHRASPPADAAGEDLVDVLLKYQQDGEFRLTTDNIKAVILDMYLGGTETSAAVVEWAMSEMVKNPSTLKKAQDEVRGVLDDKGYIDEDMFDKMKYLKLVIKETLRLHPPLPLLVPRQNTQPCEIKGYKVAARSRVIINAWALGRDPKYWNEADKFKPERFDDDAEGASIHFKGNNFEFIPFGAGRRMCPGMAFGLANVEHPLAILLYHFDWKMPNGVKNEDLDMTEALGASIKRKHQLTLIPTLERPFFKLKN